MVAPGRQVKCAVCIDDCSDVRHLAVQTALDIDECTYQAVAEPCVVKLLIATQTGDIMRAEMQALADKIEQSLVLLRRHL